MSRWQIQGRTFWETRNGIWKNIKSTKWLVWKAQIRAEGTRFIWRMIWPQITGKTDAFLGILLWPKENHLAKALCLGILISIIQCWGTDWKGRLGSNRETLQSSICETSQSELAWWWGRWEAVNRFTGQGGRVQRIGVWWDSNKNVEKEKKLILELNFHYNIC